MNRPPLRVLEGELAVCRLAPDAPIPQWAHASSFVSMTRTPGELSIVCRAMSAPDDVRTERGWRAIEFIGPLDFALVGVLTAVRAPDGRTVRYTRDGEGKPIKALFG